MWTNEHIPSYLKDILSHLLEKIRLLGTDLTKTATGKRNVRPMSG